ncbi:hypothetical protein EJB05_15512, partial [Eragrostis curvula]
MADIAFGGVEKLVKVALAIHEAVKTVKQNSKECCAIEKCATRCTALLKRLEDQMDTMMDEVMRAPLEDVEESLDEALELVKLCQRKHYFSRLWKAGDMAKELRRVQDDILRKVQVGDFATAIQATIMLTDIKNARAAPPPLPSPSLPLPPPPSEEDRYKGFFTRKHHCKRRLFTVYKGVLQDKQVVAIKNMRPDSMAEHEQSLYVAINIFMKLEHKNIIRPLGYCHEIVVELICYEGEYVGWSSLLDWSSCFSIIQGITQGVHYLHEQWVLHLDLKPGNILLGPDMNPRIGDFGLATMLVHVDDEITRDDTPAYMAPEYIGEGILSTKCDVYAFGIILIQTCAEADAFGGTEGGEFPADSGGGAPASERRDWRARPLWPPRLLSLRLTRKNESAS